MVIIKKKSYWQSETDLQKNIPFMAWLIEVAEEKIIEHRLLKKKSKSHEEFIIFTIIWMRVFKTMIKKLKEDSLSVKCINKSTLIDQYIENFYLNQEDEYLGMTINAITRESEIPRSTVKRIIENLIEKELVTKNKKNLIIPTFKVREVMKDYRQYIFKSHKKNYSLFESLNLKNLYDEDNIN
jgi:hypothetical protein